MNNKNFNVYEMGLVSNNNYSRVGLTMDEMNIINNLLHFGNINSVQLDYIEHIINKIRQRTEKPYCVKRINKVV